MEAERVPRSVPSVVADSRKLLRSLVRNASFMARLVSSAGGGARWQLYFPGQDDLTPAFPIEPGRGYLIHNAIEETFPLFE